MRKYSMLASLILFTVTGYSQFVIFGAKGGLNLSTVTGNVAEGTTLRPSFHVGGFANFLINESFTIQPEVIYSDKGVKADNGTFKFGYINVPVLLQYRIPSGFFIEAGPQIGFNVNAKIKPEDGEESDFKTYMKTTDYAWVGGIGYKSAMGLGAGVRYDFGYYNVVKAGTVKNKTIQISVFYTFGLNAE